MENHIPDAIYNQLTTHGKKLLRLILEDRFDQNFTYLEKEILLLILLGHSEYQIANTLNISARIVNTHALSIFSKLDGPSQATGAGVPRKPYPSGDDLGAEEVPEPAIQTSNSDTPRCIEIQVII